MATAEIPVPVTILTGFLGAGKTTLLNHILRGDHGLRVAVLVNDFGAINIDAALVVGVEGEAISLANGCICCTIRDDLLAAALQLLQRPVPPQYVLIEASGVSEPTAIALTFLLPEVREHLRLDSTITLVDAEQVWTQRTQVGGMIEEQIQVADLVVLNKIDLVDDAQRAKLKDWIGALVPRARILEAAHADVPLELLLGVGRYRIALDTAQPTAAGSHAHDHGAAFTTWSYVSDQPFVLRTVREVLRTLPPTIMRAKGMVALAETDRKAVFQLVGQRATLTLTEPWGNERPQTRLVFIALPGGIDATELERRFACCYSESHVTPAAEQAGAAQS